MKYHSLVWNLEPTGISLVLKYLVQAFKKLKTEVTLLVKLSLL